MSDCPTIITVIEEKTVLQTDNSPIEIIFIPDSEIQLIQDTDGVQILEFDDADIEYIESYQQGPPGPPGTQGVKTYQLYIGVPTNSTIVLLSYAPYAFTIQEIFALQTKTGSITISIFINGVPVTGLNNIIATATPQNIIATANNVANIGDKMTMILTNNAGATGLEYTMKGAA